MPSDNNVADGLCVFARVVQVFENVCELDLIFHTDKVHHILVISQTKHLNLHSTYARP